MKRETTTTTVGFRVTAHCHTASLVMRWSHVCHISRNYSPAHDDEGFQLQVEFQFVSFFMIEHRWQSEASPSRCFPSSPLQAARVFLWEVSYPWSDMSYLNGHLKSRKRALSVLTIHSSFFSCCLIWSSAKIPANVRTRENLSRDEKELFIALAREARVFLTARPAMTVNLWWSEGEAEEEKEKLKQSSKNCAIKIEIRFFHSVLLWPSWPFSAALLWIEKLSAQRGLQGIEIIAKYENSPRTLANE